MKLFQWFMLSSALLAPAVGHAATTVAPIFADHAAVQAGMPIPVWGTDAPGQTVTVSLQHQSVTATADANGKWLARLPALSPSETGDVLTINGSGEVKISDVLVGEVWLCGGQSNMEFSVGGAKTFAEDSKTANDPAIRCITILTPAADAPQTSIGDAQWIPGATPAAVNRFPAVGYYFAKKLRETLHEPVGLIETAAGGTRIQAWMPKETLAATPDGAADLAKYQKAVADYTPEKYAALYQKMLDDWQTRHDAWEKLPADQHKPGDEPLKPRPPVEPSKDMQRPSGLYQSRICALMPYAIKGALWYQGEANAFAPGAYNYRNLLPAMIAGWRGAWGEGDFPFLFVQLPRFDYGNLTVAWPLLRESQLKSLSAPNTGMAVTIDIPDDNTLHPRNKKPVGERLVPLALNLAYGQKIVDCGPMYDHAIFEPGRAKIFFMDAASGLVLSYGNGDAFEIAGADKKFVRATALVESDHLVVAAKEVPTPVAVRYAWAPAPTATLFNGQNFPASPFRTDDWITNVQAATQPSAHPVVQADAADLPITSAAPLTAPPPDHQWKPDPAFSDEFNEDKLDASKWYDHDPKWIGRPPALFLPSNVALNNGMLEIATRHEDPPAATNPNPKMWHTFTTGFVKSIALAKYGYFEVRAKQPRANVDSAFWFYKVDPDWHTEIDVFEIFAGNPAQNMADRMTSHIFTTPDYHDKTKEFYKSGLIWHAPYKFGDEFHTFGLEWDEKQITWYVDGIAERRIKNLYNHQAMNLCFDVETMPTWMGLPNAADLPAVYQIDYVRSWDIADPATQP